MYMTKRLIWVTYDEDVKLALFEEEIGCLMKNFTV